jgi:4-amino-4-deoxy-L-arabinose transferase-like glycosyltransferase
VTAALRHILLLALAFVLLYVCFFAGGGALGLTGPDEPRYAAIAQAMLETGDWVTPRLHGAPWFEKPVLYYWAAALSFRALGVNEAAARLPSGLAAVLATLGLAWLAWRITSRGAAESALLTVLILPATVAAVGFGRAATTDMLFSAMLALALVCAAELVWQRKGGTRLLVWHMAWGVFLGLATLAKGPAALVLAGGSLGLWALVTRQWKETLRLANPVSVVSFGAVALPWYVWCALRNPDFVPVFLITHNVERFWTAVFRHEQPFWFFLPILLLGLAPWLALLAPAVIEAATVLRVRRWAESRGFFVLCWVIFPLLFFSVSKSKLPGYILPAVLPLVMLCARALARVMEENGRLARHVVAAVGATFVVLAMTAGLWQKKLPPSALERLGDAGALTPWLISVGISGVAVAVLALRRRVLLALLLSAMVNGGIVLGILRLAARVDVDLSARATAAEILRWKNTEEVAQYKLHRAWGYGLGFYLHGAIPEWNEKTPLSHLLVVSDEGLLDLLERGYEVRVARRMNQRAILVFASRPSGPNG